MRLLTNYPTYNELDRLFNIAFGRSGTPWLNYTQNHSSPATNLYTSEDAYHACIELPGFTRKDIEVTIEKDILTIRAKIHNRKDESESARTVNKVLRLPEDVEPDAISAQYDLGILTVTLPKAEAQKPKQITVS